MAESFLSANKHYPEIAALCAKHLPGVEIWAYGSRINGRGHSGSDLDLVARGEGRRPLATDGLYRLRQALGESNIPFLVEVRDWAALPESFHREIKRGYAVLTEGSARDREK